ncbi:MAG: hypothetical protein H6742_03865 [Alphaproteobacteria bacterium]|nr:hypothetical protein [Alphaproteobacteria bacterium]
MIIVTGTKRSGTSMWMQILAAAGFPVIGDAMPQRFEQLQAANPAGFYESRLRAGVYFATNPDPQTGVYLHPEDTREHALKVFIPGLIRTDRAFITQVVATIRPWREYTRSMERLEAESAAARERAGLSAPPRRPELPLPVEWWFEVYHLVRDVSLRRYPFHLVSYDRVLERSDEEIAGVLGWLGGGDVEAAVAAVQPGLRTQEAPDVDVTGLLDEEAVDLFDRFYTSIHTERVLPTALLGEMNALHARLPGAWKNAWLRRVHRVPGPLPAPAPSDPGSGCPS